MQRQYTVQVSSVQEMVYRTLRDRIVSMELKPGTVISTQEMADNLSVSRTPVREAFIRLQGEDLLEIAPQRSTVVAKINMSRVYQERFIREALELEAVPELIEAATPEVIAAMRENIAAQYKAIEEKRYIDLLILDNSFHQTAFTATHEELGLNMVRQMNGHYDRIRLIIEWADKLVLPAMKDHERYVSFIEKKDVESARNLLKSHLRALDKDVPQLISGWAEYFNERDVESVALDKAQTAS